MEGKFTNIYDKKIWGGGSGTGSKMSGAQKKYIGMLEEVMDKYDIKVICDMGCGDWEFSKYINFGKRKYYGVDCVKSVVDENIKLYSTPDVKFAHKELGDDWIPKKYDLIILKDVIQHWTDEDILKYMELLLEHNKYVLCTNGFKFRRDPSKNANECRDINNRYSYHPVCIHKYPLNTFREYCLSIAESYTKQSCLFSKKSKFES